MNDEQNTPKAKSWRFPIAVGALGLIGVGGYFGVRSNTLSNAAATVRAAETSIRVGEFQRARSQLEWLLWFEPDHQPAAFTAAISHMGEGNFGKAVKLLQRIPDSSLDAEQLDTKAACLLGDMQFDAAEQLLQNAALAHPDSLPIADRLARLYLSELRRDEAIRVLMFYLVANNDSSVLLNLLELQATTQSPDAYIGPLERADEAHPNQAGVVLALARGYVLSGNIGEAKKRFEQVMSLDAKSAQVRLAVADFLIGEGSTDEAAALLPTPQRANLEFQENHAYWFLLTRIANARGKTDEALSALDRAMKLNPGQEAHLQLRSRLLRMASQSQAAAKCARDAATLAQARQELMQLFPQLQTSRPDAEAVARVAEILDSMGRTEQASRWRALNQG